MLNSIKIGNFKAFAEPQSIPIRPLTLIYGANSSGKSSILHSLVLARHAQETGNLDVHRTNIGGEAIDLGGFRQFVHRRDISRRVDWSMELDARDFSGHLGDLSTPITDISVSFSVGIALDDRDHPLLGSLPEIHSYEIFVDKQSLLRMSRRSDGKLQLDRLNHRHHVFREILGDFVRYSTFGALAPSNFSKLDDAIGEIVPEIVASGGRFLPEGLEETEFFNARLQRSQLTKDQSLRNEAFAVAIRPHVYIVIETLLSEITGTIYEELSRLQYLGPLRSYPPRTLAFSQHHDPNWLSGGGYAWDVVRNNSHVRELVNKWLSAPNRLQTSYELLVRKLVGIDELSKPLLEGLEEVEFDVEPLYDDYHSSTESPTGAVPIIKDVEVEVARICDHIQSSDIDKLSELVLIDRRSNTIVSHRDIGIGVSQVLPVLVGAYAAQDQIIAIEQPEIHLHPALQADLGDVFIQSALGENKNRFLIETHSEHLLLRIMRRMRQTYDEELPDGFPKISPKDVCVLFVQPIGTSSAIRHMELDDEGQLLDAWPGGFFEEGFRERFA